MPQSHLLERGNLHTTLWKSFQVLQDEAKNPTLDTWEYGHPAIGARTNNEYLDKFRHPRHKAEDLPPVTAAKLQDLLLQHALKLPDDILFNRWRSGKTVRLIDANYERLWRHLSETCPGIRPSGYSAIGSTLYEECISKWTITYTKPPEGFDLIDRYGYLEAVHYKNLKAIPL